MLGLIQFYWQDAEAATLVVASARRQASSVPSSVCAGDEDEIVLKAKPISLDPLTLHEALRNLVRADSGRVGLTPSRRRKGSKPTRRQSNWQLGNRTEWKPNPSNKDRPARTEF